MSPVHFIFAILLAIGADAGVANFRGTGNLGREQVDEVFRAEFADQYQHQARFEDSLRHMYTSLPKNSYSKLEHGTVRYALRRYFMNSYGWLVSGLEAEGAVSGWVPDFILAALETHLDKQGVDLHGLATLAAAIEDIVMNNSQERLRVAWSTTYPGKESTDNMTHAQAVNTLETYLMMSLSPTTWRVKDEADLARKKDYFRQHQSQQFQRVTEWFFPIRSRHLGMDSKQAVPFETVAKVTEEMDKNFHVYFDHDCRAMKSALSAGQGKRAGRVRLAAFYNMSLYGDWSFTERQEYLKAHGALDDSDPPHVIISNYALGRLNCLNETSLYSVCCRNSCEDLMSHLEQNIGAPSATTDVIAELVSQLPSQSVVAPRELNQSLLQRLEEVSAINGGQVPLHGRLFAQWMHHAYPLECPYPHITGSTNPISTESEESLSVSELREQVKADTCVITEDGSVDCGEESAELPWSNTEELLTQGMVFSEDTSDELSSPLCAFLCLAIALVLALPLMRSTVAARFSLGFLRKSPDLQNRAIVIVLLLAAAAFLADLLDGLIFGAALVSCLVVLIMRLVNPLRDAQLPKEI